MTDQQIRATGRFFLLLAAAGLVLALAGCAGTVFSDAGATRAGSGLGQLTRVPGEPCPAATFQGSIDVANLTLTCEDGQHRETFSIGSANASTALAAALAAQVRQTEQLSGLLSGLLAKLLAGAVGLPPRPAAVTTDLGALSP